MKTRTFTSRDNHLKETAKESERYAFIAEHRGGPLTKSNHRGLARWARECAEHVLFLLGKQIDERLIYALDVAGKWERGEVQAGVAMKASSGAHAVAREVKDPIHRAIARSVGQAVATAHMADHSLGGAFYALKAIKFANGNIENERDWQLKKLCELPSDIVETVQTMWTKKGMDGKI